MIRWTSTLALTALALPLPGGGGPSPIRAAPDVQFEVSTRPTADMGCLFTFRAHDNGSRQVAISRDSQVKILRGVWKKLGQSVWIQPGQTKTWTYKLTFSCGTGRLFRFIVKRFDSHRRLLSTSHFYYPEYGGWIRGGSIVQDLGDLNQYF